MNAKIFFLIFVLTFSLALAVNVDVDQLPPDYSQGDIVEITLMCSEPVAMRSTVEVFNPGGRLIYITGGNDQWTTTYNTNSDSSDGQYRLLARCEDGSTAEDFFCVDSPGCVSTDPPRSGGSGRGCSTNITCSVFSYCNATLQQARGCHDWSNCVRDYTEEIACDACLEAWSCSSWSVCQGGRQTRTCVDDHICGTLLQKPPEQQSCTVPSSAPPRVTPLPPKPPVVVKPSFFAQYKWWLLGGLLLLLLIIGAILFYYLYYKKHKKRKVFNLHELKSWISKEKAAGTSEEDIKKILSQKTGWKKAEIAQAFHELHSSGKPVHKEAFTPSTKYKPMVKKPEVRKKVFNSFTKSPLKKPNLTNRKKP